MKQKITALRTILLRGFACILSTVFGISFLLNGSAFSASAAELGDVDGDGSVTIQDACWILETYAKISAGIPTDVPSDLKITADYLPYFFSQYKYTSSRSGVPKARVNPSGHSSCTMR